ncbi:unnamed protein product [Periconia digitata]|uniref:Uncharacterized protein n=1 Tax=Periconia digitata TaxID=1303443 RepID=A0A9W4XP90_9PLEO|nr:unnamed protein product [Periconia digitata]
MNSRAVQIGASAIAILGTLYLFRYSSSSNNFTMSKPEGTDVPGLEWKLSQISRNPPSLLVTLKNNSPSPYTILKWGTPLDAQASNTGVFKVVNADTGDNIPTEFIKVNRMMPPPREDLVTIAPGTEEATEVVFNSPWMPEKKPAKYMVRAEGAFTGIWGVYGDAVKDSDVELYVDSPFNGRTFVSNEVEMYVD